MHRPGRGQLDTVRGAVAERVVYERLAPATLSCVSLINSTTIRSNAMSIVTRATTARV